VRLRDGFFEIRQCRDGFPARRPDALNRGDAQIGMPSGRKPFLREMDIADGLWRVAPPPHDGVQTFRQAGGLPRHGRARATTTIVCDL
jgi:hypothetical protein